MISFVGICEWEQSKDTPIGNSDSYGSIGAACGFASTPYTTPVVLFYRRDKWSLEASYPPSSNCRDNVPVPNATGSFVGPQIGPVCVDKVTPGEYDCCSCSFSEDEYNKGSAMGQSLGQRAWAGGLFKMKDGIEGDESPKICVVTGEFPHPLSNQTLWDLNGEVADSDPKPYSIMRYICTSLLNPENCIPNLSGTSNILFGSDSFVQGVTELCGDNPVIFMADTNAGAGDFPTWAMFNTKPLMGIHGVGGYDGLEPYTCCNDTMESKWYSHGKGFNRYASDRIAVSKDTLKIQKLMGGAVAPGAPLHVSELGYKCHASQEHLPLHAFITDTRVSGGDQPPFEEEEDASQEEEEEGSSGGQIVGDYPGTSSDDEEEKGGGASLFGGYPGNSDLPNFPNGAVWLNVKNTKLIGILGLCFILQAAWL